MDCIDLFKRAAMALQTDPRYLALDQARKLNDNDEELQNMIGEFNLARLDLNNESAKTETDAARVAELNQRVMLRDKYAQTITQAPVTDDTIEDHFLARVEQVIVAHINKGEDITVTMVADDLNITARQLHRKVTGLINQSPAALIRITRINCAKTIMAAKPEMPLKSVALACGFTDYSHFAKVFRTVTGVSPTAWTAKPTAQ